MNEDRHWTEGVRKLIKAKKASQRSKRAAAFSLRLKFGGSTAKQCGIIKSVNNARIRSKDLIALSADPVDEILSHDAPTEQPTEIVVESNPEFDCDEDESLELIGVSSQAK